METLFCETAGERFFVLTHEKWRAAVVALVAIE
jgi:hypothetical protein